MRSVAIYSPADRLAQHRYRADESFCVGEKNTPVGAYLDYEVSITVALVCPFCRPIPSHTRASQRLTRCLCASSVT